MKKCHNCKYQHSFDESANKDEAEMDNKILKTQNRQQNNAIYAKSKRLYNYLFCLRKPLLTRLILRYRYLRERTAYPWALWKQRTPIQSYDTSFVGGIQLDVFVYSKRKSSNIVLEMRQFKE